MRPLIWRERLVDPVGGIGGIMDVLVEDGKIAVIGSSVNELDTWVIDAHGLTVYAELVDVHVYLRESGFEYKETIETGTATAVHGGFTFIACMPDTCPVTGSPEQIAFVKQRATEACGAHVWPIGAVTRGQQGQELTDFEALKGAGTMALPGDEVPAQDASLTRDGLTLTYRQSLTIFLHCEDVDMVKNYAVNEGYISRQLRLAGRPTIIGELMMARDAMLTEETGEAIHTYHISTTESVALVRRYKRRGVQIICGTCPQYFGSTEDEVLAQGTLARVGPSLRTKVDVGAIIEGLKDGAVDATAIDHAPHSAEEKVQPLTDTLSGMAGLGTALAATLIYLYYTGETALFDVLCRMTINPVCVLRLPTEGRLTIGPDGDVMIFDPDETWTVKPNRFASKGRNTPLGGKTLQGEVRYTIMGSKVVYRGGE